MRCQVVSDCVIGNLYVRKICQSVVQFWRSKWRSMGSSKWHGGSSCADLNWVESIKSLQLVLPFKRFSKSCLLHLFRLETLPQLCCWVNKVNPWSILWSTAQSRSHAWVSISCLCQFGDPWLWLTNILNPAQNALMCSLSQSLSICRVPFKIFVEVASIMA